MGRAFFAAILLILGGLLPLYWRPLWGYPPEEKAVLEAIRRSPGIELAKLESLDRYQVERELARIDPEATEQPESGLYVEVLCRSDAVDSLIRLRRALKTDPRLEKT